jgi:NAD(P)-dependent dehydrogenase (short-subunit alcohol dehydrogenase family)
MQKSSSKIALVTGANKGIGFEVARQLAGRGCTVLLAARNPALGEAAAAKLAVEGSDVRYLHIDLIDLPTITVAAETIATNYGRLDILVNNAGMAAASDGSATSATLDAIEQVLRVNFIGSVAVTQAMLPLLRKSPSARIVNVSSGLGSVNKNTDPAFAVAASSYFGYCASKAALNMFTVHLAHQLRDTPIKVNSSAPGYTATDLNFHRGTQTVPEGAAETIRLALLPDDGPTGSFSETAGVVPW